MKRIIHKTTLHCAGWACVGIGLAGLVLPLIPGIVMIAVGVYIISLASQSLGLKIDLLKEKYPTFGYHFDRIDKKISKFIKKAY